MCSPVGHSLGALAVGISTRGEKLTMGYLLFCLFSGNAPDLDLVIGWIAGDINGFHHLGSHSLLAAMGYGLVVYGLLAIFQQDHGRRQRLAIVATLMYASHALLDLFSLDESTPVGMQFLWPFSDAFFAAPQSVFPAFHHDAVGGDMAGLIAGLFNWHNLTTVILEIVIILPMVIGAYWYRNHRLNVESGSS